MRLRETKQGPGRGKSVRGLFFSLLPLALTAVPPPHPAYASELTPCEDPLVQVEAPNAAATMEVCARIDAAKAHLATCNLMQFRPLTVSLQPDTTAAGFIAHYSPGRQTISLRPPEALTASLAEDSAYRQVPTTDLFGSVLVHELAHAFFLDTECGPDTCIAGHEFIAYAMQLDFLPAPSRDLFLRALPKPEAQSLAWFTDERLSRRPEVFAANAWHYFTLPGNGCDLIATILSGEATFPSETE